MSEIGFRRTGNSFSFVASPWSVDLWLLLVLISGLWVDGGVDVVTCDR